MIRVTKGPSLGKDVNGEREQGVAIYRLEERAEEHQNPWLSLLVPGVGGHRWLQNRPLITVSTNNANWMLTARPLV